jgi:dihydrofolate synthase/folylpolyglutamate synthase
MFYNIEEAVNFIFSGLKNKTAPMLDAYRHPEFFPELMSLLPPIKNNPSNVIITGSKGKGSTSVFLASILEQEGYNIGLYTSPHLLSFTERIRVNGRIIKSDDFLRIANDVLPIVKSLSELMPKWLYIGPNAIGMAIALHYFLEQNTDINIIEVGRGGILDEARFISHKFGIITKIFNEHNLYIGPELDDIGKNKAGIINEYDQTIVTTEQEEEIYKIICNRVNLFKSKLLTMNKDFFGRHIYEDIDKNLISIKTSIDYNELDLGIHGKYQVENASMAVAMSECILKKTLDRKSLHNSLKRAYWPGRTQILQLKPMVILDATISKYGAQELLTLISSIKYKKKYKKIFIVISIPEDKDMKGIIELYSRIADFIVITGTYNNYLNYDFIKISKLMETFMNKNNFIIIEEPNEAFNKIMSFTTYDDIVLLSGTLSFVSDILNIFNFKELNLW